MTDERFTKILWGMIAAMLFINLLYGIFQSLPAGAVKGNEDIGRYQITCKSAQSSVYAQNNRCYATTGKVADSKLEAHSAEH